MPRTRKPPTALATIGRGKLYLLTRLDDQDLLAYEYYDSLVVCAVDRKAACNIKPKPLSPNDVHTWPAHYNVRATFLGHAKRGLKADTVILASYNAG